MRTAALEADYDTFADALQDEGLSFNMAGNQDAVRDELRRIQLLILRRNHRRSSLAGLRIPLLR